MVVRPKGLRRSVSRETLNEGFKFPIVEVFGPTIQGEGIDQGAPCYFVRFGGCDYRCEWCDSPHAVLPLNVRAAPRYTAVEVIEKIQSLPPGPKWVVLSGGNPALFKLGNLIALFNLHGYDVALETQGSKWKDWIARCQRVAVSPKPPSAKQAFDMGELHNFLRNLSPTIAFLKIVVFDSLDYDFARIIHSAFPRFPMYLSAGNDAGATVGHPDRKDERTDEQVALDLISKGRWLANRVMVDEVMQDVKIQMQNHVLYWGNQRGR
jgi:7-carboxy-7-deazaguanine synthase